FVLDLPELMPVPWILRGMFVLERGCQPMTVLRGRAPRLRRRRHDDVRVVVAIVAMRAVRMLDHLDEAVPMGCGVEGVPVEVLIVVAVRHAAILGGRAGAHPRRRPVTTSHITRVAARTSSGGAWAIASSNVPGSTMVASSPSKSRRSSVSSATLPPMAITGMPAFLAWRATAAGPLPNRAVWESRRPSLVITRLLPVRRS